MNFTKLFLDTFVDPSIQSEREDSPLAAIIVIGLIFFLIIAITCVNFEIRIKKIENKMNKQSKEDNK